LQLSFEGVTSDFVRTTFRRTLARFPLLHDHPVTLRQHPIKKTTMRAQPVFNMAFLRKSTRHFRVEISNHTELSDHIRIEDLPEEVLTGWFAHELGHVVDYRERSALGLIGFGAAYLLSAAFLMGAERRADLFAIDHGFSDEILATKRYILEHATLPAAYKARLRRYYLSPDEVTLLLAQRAEAEEENLRMDKLL
jgi:hypothetical protein